MKVLATLPDRKHFSPIQGSERWPYQWQDKQTNLLRVCATVSNPWGQEWGVRIKVQEGKHNERNTRYPQRLDLQCHPYVEERDKNIVLAKIIREAFGGKFPYSNSTNILQFFGLPGEYFQGLVWVMISVVQIKNEIDKNDQD